MSETSRSVSSPGGAKCCRFTTVSRWYTELTRARLLGMKLLLSNRFSLGGGHLYAAQPHGLKVFP